ncbi:MAG: DUF2079 domain-containing protein [Candidatus Saccharibacteria bacterium]
MAEEIKSYIAQANVYLLSALLFFLPFEIWPQLYWYSTAVRPSHIVGTLLLLINIPMLIKRRWDWLQLPWVLLALFLLTGVISAFYNKSTSHSYLTLMLYGYEFVLAFCVAQIINKRDLAWYRNIILISGSLVVIFALWQFFGDVLGVSTHYTLLATRYSKLIFGYPRITGLSFEPATLVNYLIIPLSLALVTFFVKPSKRYFVLSVAFLSSIFLATSRSAFIGLSLISLILLVVLAAKRYYKEIVYLGLLVVMSAVFAATILFVGARLARPVQVAVPSDIQTTIPQTGINPSVVRHNLTTQLASVETNTSVQTRLDSWRAGIKVFITHPVLGIGPGNLQATLARQFNVDTSIYSGNSLSRSVYVQLLAEQGIVGSGILIVFLITLLWLAVQVWPRIHSKQEEIWLLAIVLMSIMFLVQWQSLGNLAVTHTWIFVGVLVGITGSVKVMYLDNLRRRVQSSVWLRQNKLALVISAISFGYYVLLQYLLYRKLQIPMLDLGLFNRHMYGLVHSGLSINPLKGYNLLGDHAHFFLLPLVPLYYLWQAPGFLLVLQALCIVLSGWPIYLIAKHYSSKPQLAAFWLLPYFLFFGFFSALVYSFHDSAAAVLPLAWVLYFLLVSKNYRHLCIGLATLLLFREDMPLVALMVAIYLIIVERKYWLGVAIGFVSALYFAVITKLWLPLFGPSYGYEKTNFGSGIQDVVKAVFLQPLGVVKAFFLPSEKLRNMLAMVFSFGGFSIFALEIVILLLPLWLGRFLSTETWRWGSFEHYSASQAPILAAASIIGLYRLIQFLHKNYGVNKELLYKIAISSTILLAFSINIAMHQYAVLKPLSLRFYKLTPTERSARTAFQLIPKNASVGASSAFAMLSSRAEIYYLPLPEGAHPEYIVISSNLEKWPFMSKQEVDEYISVLTNNGYREVFNENTVVILQR